MAVFKITVTSATSAATVTPDIEFFHKDNLNIIAEVDMKFSSVDSDTRSLLSLGSTVLVDKDGTTVFYGEIVFSDSLEAGGRVVHASSLEWRMGKEKKAKTVWTSTASATIFTAIIGTSSYITSGSITAGLSIDFKVDTGSSLLNSVGNLFKKTGQEYEMDYSSSPGTTSMDIVDQRGLTTASNYLNDGIEIDNLRYTETLPQGNSVTVYGKGDGTDQIKSDAANGQDATSKATWGTIEKTIIDRTIISVTEANERADKEVAKIKDPTKIYSFRVRDISLSIATGDVLLLSSDAQGLTGEEVRVTQVKQGYSNNQEILELQVCNSAYAKLLKSQAKEQLRQDNIEANSYMQGSGNTLTWSGMINGTSGAPLRLVFNVPTSFITDEAGNIRVQSMTVDYDIDPYRKGVGSAAESNVAPDVAGDSGTKAPDVAGDSGTKAPSVTGNSGDGGTDSEADTGTTSTTSNTITSSYLKIADINPDSTDTGGLFINVSMGRADVTDFVRFEFKVVSSSGSTYCSGWDAYIAQDDIATHSASHMAMFVPENTSSYLYDVYIRYASSDGASSEANWLARTGWITLDQHGHDDGSYAAVNHDHDDGSFAAVSHDHDDGTFDAASHNHSVSIGDDVNDAGSVNATSVDIYLDFWNGSAWINKHSVLSTAKILDTDVDITDSGTYPDAVGYWRIRVEPNAGQPDLVKAIIKIKHALDN